MDTWQNIYNTYWLKLYVSIGTYPLSAILSAMQLNNFLVQPSFTGRGTLLVLTIPEWVEGKVICKFLYIKSKKDW